MSTESIYNSIASTASQEAALAGLVTTTGAGVVVIKCVAASSQNYTWLKVQ